VYYNKAKGSWKPRLERLVLALALSDFEKSILVSMIGAVITPTTMSFSIFRGGGLYGSGGSGQGSNRCNVNDLLNSFSSSLEKQISNRRYFYKSATLVKEGVLNLQGSDFMSDLTDCSLEIDRRMLDFVVGLDTEFSEIVDGSHLYTPNVDLEDVILPEDIKSLVVETVANFDIVKQVQKNLEVDKKITYGRLT